MLSAIALCRTSALGGHLDVCRSCLLKRPSYNSCRNRHCPKCQALAQERWIATRGEKLLPVGHFHAVFTVPSELRPLARLAPRVVYDALFQAASATLQELARSRAKATLGITLVLHTWTRELHYHPHVHAIVSAGGLTESGWKSMSLKYLFLVEVMGDLLCGKMLTLLREAQYGWQAAGNERRSRTVAAPTQTAQLGRVREEGVSACRTHPGMPGPDTHRVAISNGRFVSISRNS